MLIAPNQIEINMENLNAPNNASESKNNQSESSEITGIKKIRSFAFHLGITAITIVLALILFANASKPNYEAKAYELENEIEVLIKETDLKQKELEAVKIMIEVEKNRL